MGEIRFLGIGETRSGQVRHKKLDIASMFGTSHPFSDIIFIFFAELVFYFYLKQDFGCFLHYRSLANLWVSFKIFQDNFTSF